MDLAPDPQVDVMNDPAYNTNPFADGAQESNGEPDHCRICRSEGIPEEPLFHPCKCSGSIKFVHQECLMEWLKHSQKKHCELCKTPFQFTKLYDPAMPSSIPTPLFLRRLFRHLVRNIILWARGALVGFVWLGLLPWCVRWMWRGWFWIGDGGWREFNLGNAGRGALSVSTPPPSKTELTGNGTSSAIGRGIIGFLMSPTLIGGKMSPVNGGATNTTIPTNTTLSSDDYPNGLFFDSNPFSNLTRYQSINNIIIDTLEGQLLTALIVVSFILIFLIREWVVQQQPALAGGAVVPPIDEGEENQQPTAEADDLPLEPVPAGQDIANEDLLNRAFGPHRGDEQEEGEEPARAARPRAIARVRRRRAFPPNEPIPVESEETGIGNEFSKNQNSSSRDTEEYSHGFILGGRALEYPHEGSSPEGSSGHPTRPQVNREVIARAAEVRRRMEEGSRAAPSVGTPSTSSAYDFGQSTERTFQFGATPSNVYTPESGSSSGSRTPARGGVNDFSNNMPSLGEMRYLRNREDIDRIDIGIDRKWRRSSSTAASVGSPIESSDSGAKLPSFGENYSEGPGMTVSPITETSEVPFSTHANDGVADTWGRGFASVGDYNWMTQRAAESSLSENARGKLPQKTVPDNWEDEEEDIEGEMGKGKEIDVPEDLGELGFDLEDDPQSHDGYSTGYLDGDDMEMEEDTEIEKPLLQSFHTDRLTVSTSEVETSDSSTQPSTPTTSDSQAAPHPQEHIGIYNFNDENPNRGPEFPPVDQLQDVMRRNPMRQIGDPRERNDFLRQIEAGREQNAQDFAAVAAAQPAARGRGVGFWNWFVGDQGAAVAPPPNPANNWDDIDTDDEGDADDAPAAGDDGAIPLDVQQAIADEDAADDFDGIMELIGMRGPIAGLVQNAAISSVLITATVALGVAFPYVTGKIVMIILAHPILFFFVLPVTIISFSAEFVVDSATCLLFSFLLILDQLGRFITKPLSYLIPALSGLSKSTAVTKLFRDWAMDGRNRVVHKLATLESTYSTIRRFPSSGVPPVSLVTRQSWSKLSMSLAWGMEKMGLSPSNHTYIIPYAQELEARGVNVSSPVAFITSKFEKVVGLVSGIQRSANVTETPLSAVPVATAKFAEPYPIYEWSVWDRVAAVFLGYACFTLLGAIYLQNARKRDRHQNRGVKKIAIELLAQAGGVMKVVLIIGIEMFVFPLYCGLLLDVALLPLFEDATILSRIQFFVDFPLTSIFVHWFVGTCYMFHFALFVSMCRKIMRSGVLYFIRDPDDPTFHPVKDVLDRPVVMQLRKIGFSALIYGVLVLVCLGGVVWGLWGVTQNVLPIHWSSNEPVLEFPVDLLFYNFFMPIAVKFFKPSDGLQTMYHWWFKRCARALRLTSFMFGERKPDEEGHQVRRTWAAMLLRKSGDVEQPVIEEEKLKEVQASDVEAYFLRDGRFVRAPASDSVRRPKGSKVFIPVSEDNIRLDGEPDPIDGPTGPSSRDFQFAYIPPWFKTRIGLVVLGIWAFAAVTGIAVTIGPLMLGRFVLKRLVPNEVKLNDIYAFSVGVYILGGILYAGTKWKLAKRWVRRGFRTAKDSGHLRKATKAWIVRAAKISYVFTAFAIVLPTLFALMIEFYVIIPIHTYFSKDEQHVIHFIQDWTLGVLYVKMMGRMLLLDAESPWARALRGVVARGYLDPDVKLATKCFIAPAGGFMLAALLLPLGLGFVAVNTFLQNASSTTISQTYRYSYPVVFAIFLMFAGAYAMKLLVDSWKQSIRDEVYLTGERLHNHGEAGSSPIAATSAVPPVIAAGPIADQAWDMPVAGDAGFDVDNMPPPLLDVDVDDPGAI